MSASPKPASSGGSAAVAEFSRQQAAGSKQQSRNVFTACCLLPAACFSLPILAFPHVPDALAGDRQRVRRVVEHFDRHPAAIFAFFESLEDRLEVDLAEARPTFVGVVGVEVAGEGGVAVD